MSIIEKSRTKTGGRQKGTPNRSTQEQRAAVVASGLTPLDYMLGLLRDAEQPKEMRFEAAKASAPYVHAKLANIEANVRANVDGSVTFTWLPSS